MRLEKWGWRISIFRTFGTIMARDNNGEEGCRTRSKGKRVDKGGSVGKVHQPFAERVVMW